MVYVCDRPNDRVQIFTKEGKFVKEVFVEKNTCADGSVWDIAFSKDPQQQFLYMADGVNEHVRVFDRAVDDRALPTSATAAASPGMFLGVHSIATDSKGNIYTTETYTGKRLQKFAFKGIGAVPKIGDASLAGNVRFSQFKVQSSKFNKGLVRGNLGRPFRLSRQPLAG